MCINFEASVSAFLIGEVFGWKLYQSNVKEYQVIGLFAMWVSIIQLIEACIYYFKPKYYELLNKLLSVCLGMQGFIILFAHKKIMKRESILYFLNLIISVIIIIKSFDKSFLVDKKECLDWNFFDQNKTISSLIFWMYMSILFILGTNNIYSSYRNYLMLTYVLSYYFIPNLNKPSMWCLTSAIITPVFYFSTLK